MKRQACAFFLSLIILSVTAFAVPLEEPSAIEENTESIQTELIEASSSEIVPNESEMPEEADETTSSDSDEMSSAETVEPPAEGSSPTVPAEESQIDGSSSNPSEEAQIDGSSSNTSEESQIDDSSHEETITIPEEGDTSEELASSEEEEPQKTPITIEQAGAYVEEHPWTVVLLRVLLILLLTYLVVRLYRKLWQKNPNNDKHLFSKFIFNITQIVIYVVGILCAIGQVPLLSSVVQTLLTGSGILALAVSLSAQESLNNIISGMFIALFKPFEVGNRITLISNNLTGNVEDITLRHTIIRTLTNTRIVVPNSKMNQELIENSDLVDVHASNYVDVQISYDSDIDLAMRIMARVIGNHPLFLDVRTTEERKTLPKVKVYVRELGENGVYLRASMWTRTVNENYDACSDARLQIKKAFDVAGIVIPYAQHTILHQGKQPVKRHSVIENKVSEESSESKS